MIGENNLFSLSISSEDLHKIVDNAANIKSTNDRSNYILEYFDKIKITNKLEIDLQCNNKIENKNKI